MPAARRRHFAAGAAASAAEAARQSAARPAGSRHWHADHRRARDAAGLADRNSRVPGGPTRAMPAHAGAAHAGAANQPDEEPAMAHSARMDLSPAARARQRWDRDGQTRCHCPGAPRTCGRRLPRPAARPSSHGPAVLRAGVSSAKEAKEAWLPVAAPPNRDCPRHRRRL